MQSVRSETAIRTVYFDERSSESEKQKTFLFLETKFFLKNRSRTKQRIFAGKNISFHQIYSEKQIKDVSIGKKCFIQKKACFERLNKLTTKKCFKILRGTFSCGLLRERHFSALRFIMVLVDVCFLAI